MGRIKQLLEDINAIDADAVHLDEQYWYEQEMIKKKERVKALEQTPYVFVYGTLRKGYWNHRLLEHIDTFDAALTVEEYKMYASGIPYVIDERDTRIVGELYKVDEETLMYLDGLEGHPNAYERKVIEVETLGGDIVNAWLYFYPKLGKYRTYLEHIKSGNFTDHKEL